MRIIDADALIKEFDDKCAYECAICKYSKDFAPCKLIDNAPTVEQEYYITGAQWDQFMKEHKRPRGKLIIKNHMETCEQCGSVMPMMNDYYRAKLRGCPYCLTEFTNLADMRGEKP